jgi:hypothetical protein
MSKAKFKSPEPHTHKDIFVTHDQSNAHGCQWLTPAILATQEAEIRRLIEASLSK